MTARAREKFYDLYAMIQGEEIPNRENSQIDLEAIPKKKKKKNPKKHHESHEKNKEIPDALVKIMEDFYSNNEDDTIQHAAIGKDIIELKHEKDQLRIDKKKKKKSKTPQEKIFENLRKDYSARTGEIVGDPQESEKKPEKKQKVSQKSVNFDLKLNTTKIFDEKCKVSIMFDGSLTPPGKGILKPAVPPKKKQKLT